MSAPGLAEEPEGEGYFASVSDLMVGVLFVFLLMLTVFALNFREDSAQLDELRRELALKELKLENKARELEESERMLVAQREAARAAREEAERESLRARLREEEATRLRVENETLQARLQEVAEKVRSELADREAARTALLERIQKALAARQIQAFIDQRSGVLRLSDAIPFETGQHTLTETARRSVTGLGEVLAEVLPCFSSSARPRSCEIGDSSILEAVLVEGHTDRQLFRGMTEAASAAQNDRLSTERALSVFGLLRQQQPVLDGLTNPSNEPLLGVAGYGQRRPLPEASDNIEAHFAQNRRIDIRFVLSSRTSDEIRQLLRQIEALQQGNRP